MIKLFYLQKLYPFYFKFFDNFKSDLKAENQFFDSILFFFWTFGTAAFFTITFSNIVWFYFDFLPFFILCLFSTFFLFFAVLLFRFKITNYFNLIESFSLFFIFFYIYLALNFSSFSVASLNVLYYKFDFFDYFLFDEFSFSIIVLTIFLYATIFSYMRFSLSNSYQFIVLLLFSFFLLIFTFIVSRFFHFYIFFESVLLPFFFLIAVWGSNLRRIWASERLMFFTLFVSAPFFFFLSQNFFSKQTYFIFNFFFSQFFFNFNVFEFIFFCVSVFIFLGVKIPLFPVHIWLPEAHGEAPTVGSILLAGLLLKLGSYGLYRFFFSSFIYEFFFDFLFLSSYFLSIFSIFVSLGAIFFQVDFKKAIAYFSIAHMAYVVLGFLTFTYEGILGSFVITLSHGLSATLLFFLVGFLYGQTHTRSLNFYSQLSQKTPYFSLFFFLTSLVNISLPGTTGFVGEQLVLMSLASIGSSFVFIPVFLTIFSGFTGILFCFKILFGSKVRIFSYSDLSFNDCLFCIVILFPVFLIGFFPSLLFF
jgi:NADH-quinone oxidoreductase subunit M